MPDGFLLKSPPRSSRKSRRCSIPKEGKSCDRGDSNNTEGKKNTAIPAACKAGRPKEESGGEDSLFHEQHSNEDARSIPSFGIGSSSDSDIISSYCEDMMNTGSDSSTDDEISTSTKTKNIGHRPSYPILAPLPTHHDYYPTDNNHNDTIIASSRSNQQYYSSTSSSPSSSLLEERGGY